MYRTLLAPLAALTLAGTALAQDAPPELPRLSAALKDPGLAAAFDAMTARQPLPDWLDGSLVESATRAAAFDGKEWLVMSACKAHDCAAHRIAVLYDPKDGAMHGVLSETDGMVERLTWLGIGGGAESIDGRTILYAALTGSLDNHPQAFNYD